MTFKEGDWVIHDYDIKQIAEMRGKEVVRVKDGYFTCGGKSLQCRPLTLKSKKIATEMRYWYNYIEKLPGSRGLNFPDINRFLITKCYEAIDAHNETGLVAVYDEVAEFAHAIENKMTNDDCVLSGVNIFRD